MLRVQVTYAAELAPIQQATEAPPLRSQHRKLDRAPSEEAKGFVELHASARQAMEILCPLIRGRERARFRQDARKALARESEQFRALTTALRDGLSGAYGVRTMVVTPWFSLPYSVRTYADNWDLRRAFLRFSSALPSPYRDFARLGDAIGVCLDPHGYGGPTRDSAGGSVCPPSVYVDLEALLREMHQRGLIPQISDDLFSFSSFNPCEELPRRIPYPYWLKLRAYDVDLALDNELLAELGFTEADAEEPAWWISARYAVDIAETLGVRISLSWLSKLAQKSPPPFTCWKPDSNRLEVEARSFFRFLWAKLNRRTRTGREVIPEEVRRNIELKRRKKLRQNTETGGTARLR